MKRKLICWLPLLLLIGCSQPTYRTTSLTPDKRAELLLKELTLEEKVALMMDTSQPVERLGIKPYNWWNEALHGVARAGLATVFPQPIGMAASFSPQTVYEVFNAVSDEARAKNTYYASQGSYERYQGLTMWTPTVNIYRDPRWGRGIETYGEDRLDEILEKPLDSEIHPFNPDKIKLTAGSTDVGDVGYAAPTLNINIATACVGNVGHSWQMVAQSCSPLAHKGLLTAAKVMALSCVRTMDRPDVIEAAKKELKKRNGGHYTCPLPDSVQPPLDTY